MLTKCIIHYKISHLYLSFGYKVQFQVFFCDIKKNIQQDNFKTIHIVLHRILFTITFLY